MKTFERQTLDALMTREFANGICFSCKNKILYRHRKHCSFVEVTSTLKEQVKKQEDDGQIKKEIYNGYKKLRHNPDHGIKVGDTVKIIRRVGGFGFDNHKVINSVRYNWENTWNSIMTFMLEHKPIQKVKKIHPYAKEIGIESDNGNIYYFPSTAVRRIKKYKKIKRS